MHKAEAIQEYKNGMPISCVTTRPLYDQLTVEYRQFQTHSRSHHWRTRGYARVRNNAARLSLDFYLRLFALRCLLRIDHQGRRLVAGSRAAARHLLCRTLLTVLFVINTAYSRSFVTEQNSQASKAYLFDIKSRLYVATDTSPPDSAHNLCCDYLKTMNSFGSLYK